ncbi:hypothetical protein ABVK25_001468 [Lepraria finkii]|uniref:Uncharacterized protein n=1 Tax=Lepraria finkii TaxID=1340010 RepID=A0ABR4BJ50_9LECA
MSAPGNTDASTTIPERAVDFLGFAAQFGLSLYVQEVIESRPERLNSTATYLLRCAMCYAMCLAKSSRAAHYKYSKYLELIATRIGRGGKPYAPIFSATIWISFLEEMFDMTTFARLTWPGRETPFDSAQTSKTRAIAAKTFLENGAKVHEITYFSVPFPVNPVADTEILDAISGAKLQSVHIEMQLSTPSTLEKSLEGGPEWANIHRLCNTKGARFYSKCTHLTFQRYSGGNIEHCEHS